MGEEGVGQTQSTKGLNSDFSLKKTYFQRKRRRECGRERGGREREREITNAQTHSELISKEKLFKHHCRQLDATGFMLHRNQDS